MLYSIAASVVTHTMDGCGTSWEHSRELPIFFLDSDLLGIMSAHHAKIIARDVICAPPDSIVYIDVLAREDR